MLANGHVLTFATFVSSWEYTTIQANSATQNLYVGEQAVICGQGSEGAHMLTVVGYDDRVWIDINQNGQVDEGELGAFLIVNSWGPNWSNKGFIWVAYDAFFTLSAVQNGPDSGRVSIATISSDCLISSLPKALNYGPTIVAEFELSQTQRNQILMEGGSSNTTQTTPSAYFTSGAIVEQGGPYRFDGTSSSTLQEGTFYMDLSDVATAGEKQRYFLKVFDTVTGNPTYLDGFNLIDIMTGRVVPSTNSFPLSVDATSPTSPASLLSYVDYELPIYPGPKGVKRAANASHAQEGIEISSPVPNEVIQEPLFITINTNEVRDIQRVEFYLGYQLIGVDDTAPYMMFFQPERFKTGKAILSAVAYRKQAGPLKATVPISIQR
jgi:hypothetical protein